MIIAIDFDGTIVESNFPKIGTLMPFAKECINQLAGQGHYIIIWTCRSNNHLTEAINFLLREGITFHSINGNEPTNMARYNTDSRKVYAHMYIDDKNVGGFPGWPQCLDAITLAEAEYQKNNEIRNSSQTSQVS